MVGRGGGVEADSFWFKYTLSATAATVAETVTYPLDLTKTRLQIQGEKGLSGTAAVPYRGMIRTATGIVHEEGPLQLWQGVTPALYRHIVYTGSRMTVYEVIREKVLGKNPDGTIAVWKAVVGGICAGAIGQLIASPTDLVKVQMQMDGVRRLRGKKPRFENTAHAFRKIVHHGGIRGLWSGVVPNVQRAALVNMGDMATYDTVKHQLLLHTNLTDNYVTHTMSSACSGVVAAVLGTPADVVKTRIMNQKRKHGKGVVYKSSLDCLMKTVNQEGFWALYKGFLPIWARMAPWSLTFWLTYEQVRKMTGASSF
ncbi:LOW QUALITY PROTEIN: mitochondrial uncoupling protein 4-like [Liolophura sinensis]|uniref:LOW QUALITY PROTEIN: mitochondrial uncoupling protein 4-like n=1 Tax=Liolophura sinensis TaxID=3198878 RepID=UPI00315804DB